MTAYLGIVRETISKVGPEEGLFMGLSALFLDRDALFRSELAQGDSDERVMLSDWELGLALNHSLRYLKPDATLRTAIIEGRMKTREDVKRELTRMLDDESIRKPRVLQFFRDYLDYDLAPGICKDEESLDQAGLNVTSISRKMIHASISTDRLVELVLQDDQDVLKRLLTSQEIVTDRDGTLLLGKQLDPQAEKEALLNLEVLEVDIKKVKEKRRVLLEKIDSLKKEKNEDGISKDQKKALEKEYDRTKKQYQSTGEKLGVLNADNTPQVIRSEMRGDKIYARVGRKSFGKGSLKPDRKLSTLPEGERLGILTHPAWLVSHSDAMDNHAIHRGIWIRERLLGGGIPDVPITVDAQLPDEPDTTLRHRMRVTRETYCWSCHQKMDPLGLPFEMYNHAGLYREYEQGEPVDTSGEIIDSGDPTLDGPVTDALDMINKLAHSEHVEQVFIRHAFRYWMGRNETIHDAPVLQEAHQAYKNSGGSMKSLITSLVTSDAFLYRE